MKKHRFYRYKKIIDIMSQCMRVMPKPICLILWNWSSNSEGHFCLFIRYLILRRMAASVGDNVYVGKYVVIKGWKNINIGSDVSIHAFCYLEGDGGITLGDQVAIANHCSLISANHTWQDKELPIRFNPMKKECITIKDDVWLGCGVRVLAGTIIESRCVVAAGAVARGHLDQSWLYGGVPTRRIKPLLADDGNDAS